jgi:ATP-binding cassette subfamily B protein
VARVEEGERAAERSGQRALRRRGWRLLAQVLRRRKGFLGLGVLAAVLWTGARLTIPLLAAAAVDQGIVAHDGDATLKYAILIVVVGLVQAAGFALRRFTAFALGYRVETDLRDMQFAHLQRLHFAFHDQAQTGQLISRANTDLLQITQMLMMLPITLSSILILAGVATVMVIASPVLAVLALGSLPLLTVLASRFSHRMGPVAASLQEELGGLSGVVEESIAGVRVVKGFGGESRQVELLDARADSVWDRAIAAANLRAGVLPFLDLLPAFSLIAILWYGGHLVIDGDLEVGQLIAFNIYILMLVVPLRLAGQLVAQATRASVSAGRVAEILDTAPEITDPAPGVPLPPGAGGEVTFEGVHFSYGDGPPVLDGLDLVLRPGEAVALVGPTASGKTTAASLVARFYDVDRGCVRIDGVDVRDVALHELRRAVGIVFEETFLFTDTVRENLAFADADASMDDIRRATRLAGAADFIDALPDGYDTIVGEHGFSLSGGQRQRIAIARAVIADPRVLILDDATSSVDPTKEHEIRAALREVMAGRTTLIIAHRPATIALADRVVLLHGGRAADQGTHEELLTRSDLYRSVLAHATADATTAGGNGR